MSNFISSTHSSMALRSQMSSRRDWIFTSSWEGFLLVAAALVVSSFSCKEKLSNQLVEPLFCLFGYFWGLGEVCTDMVVCRFWICLRIRAVVHEHHVIFSSYFLKCAALIPFILSFVKEPGEKQSNVELMNSLKKAQRK